MSLNLPWLSWMVPGARAQAQLPQAGQRASQWFCVMETYAYRVNVPLMSSRLAVTRANLLQGPCIFSKISCV